MLLAPVTDIFCDVDDFYNAHQAEISQRALPNPTPQRQRATELNPSEIMTILILFHMSHFRTFKDFYQSCVLEDLSAEFPQACSYPRFVVLIPRVFEPLTAYVLSKAGDATKLYYLDSTKLVVCHNKRIYRNKVFKNIATRGKSSMGWFYGFKLHLVINHKGEIINFCLTKANVDDRTVVSQLMKGLSGLAAADKGYLGKKLEGEMAQQNIKLITKLRKNMKKKILSAFEKFFLGHRGLVETVIEQLKSVCHIEHSRHRSPLNFVVHLVGGLAAYCLKPLKPSVKVKNLPPQMAVLIHN